MKIFFPLLVGVLAKNNCWECSSQEQPIGKRSGPCWDLLAKEGQSMDNSTFDNDEIPEHCDNGKHGCGISIAVKGNVEDIQRYCIQDRDSWYHPGCQDMSIPHNGRICVHECTSNYCNVGIPSDLNDNGGGGGGGGHGGNAASVTASLFALISTLFL